MKENSCDVCPWYVDAREIGLNEKVRNKPYCTMIKSSDSAINGKCVYARIPIRRIQNG